MLFVTMGCGGPTERKAKYLMKAEEYIQAGNFPKARVALRNVLKIDPKDEQAYFLYAQVEEKEKNWFNAFHHYQQVIELQPDHEGALVKLGKFYLQGRRFDKAHEIAEKLLALHPGHVPAQALRIALKATEGSLQEATTMAESLSRQYPTEPDVAVLLGTLYSLQDAHNRAVPVLARALDAHPQDPDLLNTVAMAYVRMKDRDNAESIFLKIIAQEPTVFDHYVKVAHFFDDQQLYDKAEGILREAIRLDPDNEQRHLVLADYVGGRRNLKAAEAVLQEAHRQLPHAANVQFAQGRLLERQRELEKARAVYEDIRDRNLTKPAADTAKVKLAALDWVDGEQEAATQLLQEVLRHNPRASEALMLQGRISLKMREGGDAVQAFRTVLKDQPYHAEAYALLGQAHLILEETSLAKVNLEKAVGLSPNLHEAHLTLAILEAFAGRNKDARLRLEELLKQAPTNLDTLGMLLNVQAAERDWTGTEQTLNQIRAAGAPRVAADLAEGILYQSRLQWDEAMAAFERASAANPDAPEPIFALVRIFVRQGKLTQAQDRLVNLIAQSPNHPFAHGLLGEILILQGKQTQAEEEFRRATTLNPDWITPWINWTTLKHSQHKADEANAILQRGLQANPQNEDLRFLLATSLGDRGQIDQAIAEYESILQQNPRALLAANNLASLLIDFKGDPNSLDRAMTLSRDFEQRVPNPFFLDTLGWAHLKMGHREDALRVLRRAVADAPQHPSMNYHLGMAHYQAGHRREAAIHLEKALNLKIPFHGIEDARTVLAEING